MVGSKKMVVLLVICVVLLGVAVVAGAFVIRRQMSQKAYSEAIETAEKYVDSGVYSTAIMMYENAINMDPDEEEGYIGLAEVYIMQGDEESAIITLQRGYSRTNSEKLRYMVRTFTYGEVSKTEEMVITAGDLEEKTVSGEFGLDTAFLQKLENYTFEDYLDEYGNYGDLEKIDQGESSVVHENLEATFYYANTDEFDDIVDLESGVPDTTAMPERVTLDNISLLFRNFDGTVSLEELQELSSSKVEPIETSERTYVELSIGTAVIRIETDEDGNIVSDTPWNEIILTEANKNRENSGLFSGVVIDAETGDIVPGATVAFMGEEDSSHSYTTTTDANGAFELEVEPDTYTVTISADGYLQEEFVIEVEEGENYTGQQFVISQELESGTVRIVLEWNAQPWDLDSYLRGETDDGDRVAVSYYNKQSTAGDDLLAELDVDDTDGYGPETITLYEINGVYTYTVEDFRDTGTMQEYGATVKVYLPGQSQPTVIELSQSAGVENVWEVFTLDHGELEILNRAG